MNVEKYVRKSTQSLVFFLFPKLRNTATAKKTEGGFCPKRWLCDPQ